MLKLSKTGFYKPLIGHMVVPIGKSIVYIPTRKYIETNPGVSSAGYDAVKQYNRIKHFVKLAIGWHMSENYLLDFVKIHRRTVTEFPFITKAILFHALEELISMQVIEINGSHLHPLDVDTLGSLGKDMALLRKIVDGKYDSEARVSVPATETYFSIHNDEYGIYIEDLLQICEPFKFKLFAFSVATELHLFCSSSVGWFGWDVERMIKEKEVEVNKYPTLVAMLKHLGNLPTYFENQSRIRYEQEHEDYLPTSELKLYDALQNVRESTEEIVILNTEDYGDFWSVLGYLESNGIKLIRYDRLNNTIECKK